MFEIVDGYFLSVIIFFIILGAVIYRDRKNMEFHLLVIMRRTKRFRTVIDRVAKISPRFWKALYSFGVVFCFLSMAGGLLFLLNVAINIIKGTLTTPALGLVLPTPTTTPIAGAGFILLPFWLWMALIACILMPHEISHGIIARAEKIRLKSVGLLLLAIFPGAFVEPDEKQLKRSKLSTRLRIFAAGSFANFMVAALVFLLAAHLFWPAADVTLGLYVTNITSESSLKVAGVPVNSTITQIDGKPIEFSYYDYVAAGILRSRIIDIQYAYDFYHGKDVGDEISITADGKEYRNLTLIAHPDTGKPSLGFNGIPFYNVKNEFFFFIVLPFLTLLWLFSLGVGIVNILPIYPLDGGLIADAVLKKFFKRKSKAVLRAITFVTLVMLIFAFVGPWMMGT